MDNSQTLELQIKSKAQEAKASVESLVKSLTNVENVLTNIYLEMGSIEKKTDSSINKSATATKNINQLKQSTDKATSSADKLGNAFKKVFTFAGVKRLTTTALGWMNEAIDYTEQLNLFNVVFDNTEKNGKQMFSELGKSALQFQYKMNEAFGTNKTQTLYMQGIFESMGETVGIEDKYSSIMSETMTKLTYDLASLYNKTEKTTAEAIRAGVYAAQTKPLRSYGIDVTQSSLQPIAESLGITESVKNMSQAEKEILRYIATLKQAKIAMGDFANTCESPSNQLKILRQQLVEAKVALSSLFIGTFSKILPYANAILMVIKEVSKAIADMFGIELKDYNSGIASQEGIYDGIADSADDASKAVKELKRQTLGFDEIHNINENKDSGGNSGGTSGGIDQRLLDAIQGYDNGMDKVRMKATEIRDKMMEWLGFTKEIDPLTGEVSFKLTNTNTSMGKIIEYLKDIVKYGKEAITGVFKVIKDDFDNGAFGKILVGVFKSIKDLLGFIAKHKSAQKTIAKLVEAFLLFKTVKAVLKPITGTIDKLRNSISKLTGNSKTDGLENIGKFKDKIKKTFNIPDAKTVVKGMTDLAIVIGGATVIVTAIGLLTKIPGFNETVNSGVNSVVEIFKGISKIIIPLTAVSAGVALMGSLGISTIAKGIADLAIVVLGTEAIVVATGFINNIAGDFISSGIDNMKKIFNGIADIGLTLGVLSAALMGVGLLGGAGALALATGIADLAIVVGGVSILLAGMGALKQIPGFDWLVGEGGKLLCKLGDIIGGFAGSIVKGFADKATEALPNIGTHLSEFMTNATPFFEKAQNINESSINAIGTLAKSIMLLTASDILNGLFSWLTGGDSLVKFGKDLSEFAPYFSKFAKAMVNVDASTVTSSATAAKSVAEFANNVPNSGGLAAWFAGSNNIDDFGKMLPNFGKNFKKYSENISGLDTNIIKNSADSAKSISEMAKNLPNHGGVVSWFTGDNKLSTFSECLPSFGKNLKKYSDNIKGISPDVVTNSANSAKAIAEFAKNLPNQGGVASWFAGDNKISTFGKELSKFGNSFKEYYNAIKSISIDKINNVTSAIKDIVNQFKRIKDEKINTTITDFGKTLKNSSGNISSFFNSSFNKTTGWSIGYTFGSNIGSGIKSGIKTNIGTTLEITSGKSSIKKYNIKAYANGGMPEDGLFFANHNELVGKFNNGKTAVANNEMIVEGIKSGVYEAVAMAMSQFNGQSGEIEVHVHTDEGTVIDRIEQRTKQTGKFPLTIPTC